MGKRRTEKKKRKRVDDEWKRVEKMRIREERRTEKK